MSEHEIHHESEPPPIEGLETWATGPEPPPALEASVFTALRREGLVGSPSRWPRMLLAAAFVVAIGAGFLIGLLMAEGRAVDTDLVAAKRQHFLLLLFEDEHYQSAAPERQADRVREYAAWASEPHGTVQVLGGERLDDETIFIPGGPVDGPRLAGFFELEADALRDAHRVALTCPHLRYGGTIEVRAIEPTPSSR